MIREERQNEIIFNLVEMSNDRQFHFSEIPTGTGKTKILLEVALKNIADNRSVIISTANNLLVSNFLDEAKKFNIKDDKIEFVIGKDNYINQEIVLSEEFLFHFSLDPNSVKEWLATYNGKELISLFVSDFSLPDEAEDLLRLYPDNEERNIKETSERIGSKAAVYITNHYYLLALLGHANPGTLNDVVILCDEAHLINNTAKNIFKNTFSPFRLKYLLFGILKNDWLSKTGRKVIEKTVFRTDILLADISVENKSIENGEIKKSFLLLSHYKDEIYEPLSKYLAVLQKKNPSPIVSAAYRELKEMVSVLATNGDRKAIDVSISPVKGYPTFSTNIESPVAILRKRLSNHIFTFIGVSGTIRVSTATSIESNRWSFERLGFYKYKHPETDMQKTFNDMIDNISLAVYPSIFSKEQARYYIAKEERYKIPASKKGRVSEKMYAKWIESLADLCKETLWGNSVVLMSSFENIATMKEKLEENGVSKEYTIFDHRPGVSMRKLLDDYKKSVKSGKKSLLIGGLGFYTGIDLHGDFLNTLFLGKLPIEPSSYYSRTKIGSFSAQSDMRKNALLTFRQGLGRAIRTENDRALIVVADPRIATTRYRIFEEFLREYALEISL